MRSGANQHGFILMTVVIAITLIAAITLALSFAATSDTRTAVAFGERDQLRYLVEAGVAHAELRLSQNGSCSGYTDIPSTVFGNHNYSATITPSSGSPVSISVTGALATGATQSVLRDNTKSYESPSTLVIQPGAEGKDSFIEGEGSHQDHNKGSNKEIKTDSETGKPYRGLLQFDLSGLPDNIKVLSAELALYVEASTGNADTVSVYALSEDWVEDDVTWLERSQGNNWTNAGGDYTAGAAGSFVVDGVGWKSTDIVGLVQQWADTPASNRGVLLSSIAASGNSEKKYASGDGDTPGLAPKLTVTFACECGAVCPVEEPTMASFAHWKLDDGGGLEAVDSAGGNNAELKNSPLWVDGRTGGALEFDGVNDYLLVPDSDVLPLTSTFTAMAWVRYMAPDPFSAGRIMSNESSGSNDDFWMAFSTASLIVNIGDDVFSPSLSVANDTWYHVAVVYADAADTVSIYVDGSLVLEETTVASLSKNAAPFYIGKNWEGSKYWDGLIDDVRLYDSALDASTIAEIVASADEGSRLLFIVADVNSLLSIETEYRSLLEGWGYEVQLIDDNDSQSNFDAAVLANDVIFASATIWSSSLVEKVLDAPIGFVVGEHLLVDEYGFASTVSNHYGMTTEIILTHYVTSPFAIGEITVSTVNETVRRPDGTLSPDLIAFSSLPSEPLFVALEAGDQTHMGTTAAGRRVYYPWATSTTAVSDLTDDAKTLLRRALQWGSGADSADSDPDPIAHWMMDETTGSVVADAIGDNDGTMVNGPLPTLGKLDGGLSFDGNNDYVDVSSMNPRSYDDLTISAWYKSADTSVSDDEYIFVHIEGFITDGVTFGPTDDGSDDDKLRFTIDIADVADRHYGTTDIVDQQWHHLVAVRADGRVKLYVDGIVESDQVDGHAGNTAIVDGSGPFIGDYPGGTEQVHGILDDVRLYDRGLTAEEVAALFSAAGGGGSGGGGAGSCDGTFRDEFEQESFSNDDGTLNWRTDWLEIGESNGADSGDIRVWNDSGTSALRTRDSDNGGEGVERGVDLSGATSATLTYSYRRSGLDNSNDYTSVLVSANGDSGPWIELLRHEGGNNDSNYVNASHNISSFISATTQIRLLTSPSMGGSDTVYFDDIEITCSP